MSWLTENWHDLCPDPWIWIVLVLAAAAGGAAVGFERETKAKPVGMRTLALVSIGSAVFTMMSEAFTRVVEDPTRIPAQVVTGIGFLGAGVILRGQFGVTGLTSAATIWAVAAAGMLIGTGYAGAGLALCGFLLLLLLGLSALEHRYSGACTYISTDVHFIPQGGKAWVRIEEVLDEYHIAPKARKLAQPGGLAGESMVTIRHCNLHPHHRDFLARLAELSDVTSIATVTGSAGSSAATH